MKLNNIIIFLFICIFIPGCVSVNIARYETIIEQEKEIVKEKIPCDLNLIKDFSQLPDLPVIPSDKKSDHEYVASHLVTSINDHRIKLKEIKKVLSQCNK
jgi:hypothetical protein